jgi:hypothetical protein
METAASDLDSKLARRAPRGGKRRKSRSSNKIGMPAPVVFWLVVPVGAAGIAMPMIQEVGWVLLTGCAIILQIVILRVNDGRGFIRSREMRRAYEAVVTFRSWK